MVLEYPLFSSHRRWVKNPCKSLVWRRHHSANDAGDETVGVFEYTTIIDPRPKETQMNIT